MSARTRSSSSRRRAGAVAFPIGTPLLQAARSLGVDIDSVCGGRGLCGRCQVLLAEGDFAKHGVDLARRAPVAVRRGRAGILPPPADGAGPPAVVLGARAGRSRDRRAVRQPGASAGRAQGGRSARHRARSRRPAALRRGAAARHARSFGRPAPARGCARLRVAAHRARLRRARAAAIAAGAAQGRLEGDGGGARRQPDHRRLAGLPRARLRHRDRRRLDDDRRASLRSVERRSRGGRRRDESADPLRRRPDEPRVLGDDESRRREGADRHRARRDQRARRRRRAAGGHRARGHPRSDVRRQSDHAPPAARHQPGRAGRRAVRARDRLLADALGDRDRLRHSPQRAHLRAAVHRGARRRRRRGRRACRAARSVRRDDAAGRHRHQRGDRARQPQPAPRLLEPDRTCVRRRADQLRPARGARRDRARAHRSRDARAALQGDRLRALVERAGLRGSDRRDGRHRHLRLRHHRGDRGAVSRRRDPAATARSTASSRRAIRAFTRTAARMRTSCTSGAKAARRYGSRRTTCARSSSPRPRSTPACGC